MADFICARVSRAAPDGIGSGRWFAARAPQFTVGQLVSIPMGAFPTAAEAMAAVQGSIGAGTLIRWLPDASFAGGNLVAEALAYDGHIEIPGPWIPVVTSSLWNSDSTRPSFSDLHLSVVAAVGGATLDLDVTADLGTFTDQAEIAVFDGGVLVGTYHVGPIGSAIISIHLAGGTHNIVVRDGPTAYTWAGVRTNAYRITNGSVAVVAPVAPTHRMFVIGDSIADGFLCDNPTTQAWSQIIKDSGAYAVTCHSGGGWTLAQFGAAPATIVSQLVLDGTVDNTVWIALGYNDWLGGLLVATYQTYYEALVDAIHAAYPAARIVCQSPITATVETTLGQTLAQFREAVLAVCATRSWCTQCNGATQITATLSGDGVHPAAAGNVQYAASVSTILTSLNAWQPTSLATLVQWLDGASFAPGADASAWADNANAHDVAQVVAGSQGALVKADASYGGQPTVNVAGGKYYDSAAFAQAQPMTWVVVGNTGGGATDAYVDAIAQFCLVGYSALNSFATYLGTGWVGAALVGGLPHCHVVVCDGANTTIYVDDSSVPFVAGDAGADGILGGDTIGRRHDTADRCNGKLACVAVFSEALDASDVANVMAWAGKKYGQSWS